MISACNYAQEIRITGTSYDKQSKPLETVLVQVRNLENEVLDYTYTNDSGNFELLFNNNDDNPIIIEASSLGYTSQKRELNIEKELVIHDIDFILEEKTEFLKEVLVEGHQKIRISSDTTFIRVSQYTTDNEQTVEDILKRLPGIEVLEDGSIKAHGKPIESLLIEGENLLDDNYKILSKNLDAKTLEEVQILDNYEENPIFKQLSNSEKVALNLKLKDEYNYVLFGNVSGGYGLKDRYEAAMTLGLLRKKIKFLEFSNFNNIGDKGSRLLQSEKTIIDLSQMFQKIEKKPFTIFSIDQQEEDVFNSRSVFNNSMLHSLGASTKFNEKLTLRGDVNIIADKTSQDYQALTEYFTGNSRSSFFETSTYANKNRIASSEIEFKFSPDAKNYFSNTVSYYSNPHEASNSIILSDQGISQNNEITSETFYNHLEHSYLLSKTSGLYNYLYFGYGNSNEIAQIIYPGLRDLFPVQENSFYQKVGNRFTYYGLQSTLISKYNKWENDLQLQVHNETETANSRLFTETQPNFEGYSNNLEINDFFIGFSNSLKYKLKNDSYLKGSLALKERWFNNKNYLLNNSNFTFRQKLKQYGVIRLSYTYKEELPGLKFLLPAYAITSYQSFNSGSDETTKLKNSIFSLNYSLYNDLKGFSINSSLLHTVTHDGYASNTFANENFIFNGLLPTSKGHTTLANLAFTNYFSTLQLATNLDTNQSFIRSPLFLDQTEEISLKNYSGIYSFSVSSYFDKWLNFSSGVQYRFSKSEVGPNSNEFTSTKVFADFETKLGQSLKVNLNNEFYFQNNEEYFFSNAEILFEPKKKRWSASIMLNNLLDEKEYLIQRISSFKYYQKRINLVPAYALLKLKYRF